MGSRHLARWTPLLAVAAFAIAVVALKHALREHSLTEIAAEFAALPARRIVLSIAFTIAGFGMLALYERLGLAFVGARVSWKRSSLASFLHYALVNSTGLGGVAGHAVRLRLYTSWGLSPVDVAKHIAFCSLTFWSGFLALAGVVFLVEPPLLPSATHIPEWSLRPLGAVMLALLALFVFWSARRSRPFVFRSIEIRLPSPRVFALQILVSSIDWLCCGAALFVLLPHAEGVDFALVLGVFLVAQVVGLASHVPGGVGIFESIVLLVLAPEPLSAATVLGALLAWRVVYYVAPLVIAGVLLGSYELTQRERLRVFARAAGRSLWSLTPDVLAIATFLAGVVLLLSGATPSVAERVRFLERVLPLSVIEASHFLASVLGVALLVIANGLRRRIDAAWVLSVGALLLGAFLSLLKGLDWEEAGVLTLVAAALGSCRGSFHRRSALFTPGPTPWWVAATALVVLASITLGVFAFQRVDYSDKLWTDFSFFGDAPRSLRAGAAVLSATLLFALYQALRPEPHAPEPPSAEEMKRVNAVVRSSASTAAHLALLGDKSFLWSENGRAFVMYAPKGKCLVAMGDPVGPVEEWPELLWRYRELCDRHDRWPVFYEVTPRHLHLYVDMGLSAIKLGEDALVDLRSFTLEGGSKKTLRHARRKAESDGSTFEVVLADAVPALLPELRAISDAWLADKATKEKGFSLGYFDEVYLATQPVALVRRAGRIEAFANLWLAADLAELSIDLMRHRPDCANGIMEFLFVEILIWGQTHGYARFDLGMAPLSGLEARPLAPTWNRLGSAVFRHAEHFYNFQGLRAYKEKFDPLWEPRYLVWPGGVTLPIVFANVTALVARGR